MASILPPSSVISKPSVPTAAGTPFDTVNPMTAVATGLAVNAIPHSSSVNAIATMAEADFFDMLRACNVNAAVLTRELPGLTKLVAKAHRGLVKKGMPVPGHILRIIPILVMGGDDIEKCRTLLTALLGDAGDIRPSDADAIGDRVELELSPALISAPPAPSFTLGASIAVTAIALPGSTVPPLHTADIERHIAVAPPISQPTAVPTIVTTLEVAPRLSAVEVATARLPAQVQGGPSIPAAKPLPAHPPVTTLKPPMDTVASPPKFGPPGRALKGKGKGRAREREGSITEKTPPAAVADTSEEDELESEEEPTGQGRPGAVAKGKRPQRRATQRSTAQVKMEAPSDDGEAPSESEELPTPAPRALRSSKRQRKVKAAPKTPAFVRDSDEDDEEAPVEVDRYAIAGENEEPCKNCQKRSLTCSYVIDRAITQCQRCQRLKAGCSISAAKLLALKARGEKRVRRSGAGMAPRASTLKAKAEKSRSRSSGSIMKGEFSGTPDPAAHVSFAIPDRPSTRSSSRLVQQLRPTAERATEQVQNLQREMDDLREELTRVRRDHAVVVATMNRRFHHLYETQAVLSIELARQIADGNPCALWLGRPPNRESVSMEVAMAQQAQLDQSPESSGHALPAVDIDGPPAGEEQLLHCNHEQETAVHGQPSPHGSTDVAPPLGPPSHSATTHDAGPCDIRPVDTTVILDNPVVVSEPVNRSDRAPTSLAVVPQMIMDIFTSVENAAVPAVKLTDDNVSTTINVNAAGVACDMSSNRRGAIGLGEKIATLEGTGDDIGSGGHQTQVARGQKRPRSRSIASDRETKRAKLGNPE